MFHLVKILNGRVGVPEPEHITLSAAATVSYGTPVIIKGGTLTKMSNAATSLPTHLVLADSTQKEVLVAPISSEMVFEVPVASAPTAMTVGSEYLLSADGMSLSATEAASGKRGAVLVSKAGAEAVGDTLLVRFCN